MTKKYLLVINIVVLSLLALLIPVSISYTWAHFIDKEFTASNTFTSWTSRLWTQTYQSDFESGVPYQVDTTSSPGDVRLAITDDGMVRDDYDDYGKTSAYSNVVIVGGVLQLGSSGTIYVRTERPNANRAVQLTPYPTGTPNWQCVSEVTPDYQATYVYGTTAGTYQTDYYRFPNLGASGTVSNVTVYFMARSTADTPTAYARAAIYTPSGGESLGAIIPLTTTWTLYSHTFYYQPNSTNPWTTGTLNQASFGISLMSATGNQAQCTQAYIQMNYGSAAYYTSGTLTSVNLLSGITNTGIDSFTYNAPLIQTDLTAIRVQFSQDGTSWYSAAGVLNNWDTLMQGINTISLAALNWSGPNFYYRVELTTTNTATTPLLEYIQVNYSYYYASGSIASQVYDTNITSASWDALIWDELVAAGTDINFEVRASDTPFLKDALAPAWVSAGGTSPVLSGLPAGRYKQWRAILTTTNSAITPVLHEVRVYYDP